MKSVHRPSRDLSGLLSRYSSLALRAAAALAILFAAWWNVREARRIDLAVLQDRAEIAVPLDAQHPLLQSFVPQANHLTALELNARLVHSPQDNNAALTLHLRRDRQEAPDIAQTSIRLDSLVTHPQFTFSFAPEPTSREATYFLIVETDAEADTVTLWASADNALDSGALFANGQPVAQDLALRAYAEIEPAEMLGEFAAHIYEFTFLLALTLAFSIVGWGLTALFKFESADDLAVRFIISLFTGLALVIILYAACAVLNLALAPLVLRAAALLSFIAACLILLRAWIRSSRSRSERTPRLAPNTLVLAALFLFALVVRLLQITGLDAPLWVDGLIHENLVETILARGGIPGDTLYHVGLHSLVAFLVSITGLASPQLLLLTGAWTSALGGLSLYALAKKLFDHDLPALFSATVIWFFAPFPSYLITWSRLPFLLGLAFLPLAIRLTLDALNDRSRIIPAAVVVAGLVFSHFGTFSLWAVFLLAWLIVDGAVTRRSLFVVLLVSLPALALLGARLVPHLFDPRVSSLVASSRAVAGQIDATYLFQITLRFGGIWVWGVSALGALVALFANRKILWLVLGWFAAEYILGRVQSVFFGEILTNTTNWIIALSVPLALLAGVLAKWLITDVKSKTVYQLVAAGYLLLFAFLGGRNLTGIVNPSTVLLTPADARAMEWVRANTPPSARFLVNSFYWGERSYLPADGGGWLNALTQRVVEYPRTADEAKNIRDLIRDRHLAYVYLGHGTGVLERSVFDSAREFKLVYDRDGVRVFQVLAPD